MGQLLKIAYHESRRGNMLLADSSNVNLDRGLDNDFRGSLPGRQVTVLSQESWNEICTQMGEDLPWTLRRANLLVSGIDLSESCGAQLMVGAEVVLQVMEETTPCERMDEAFPGLRKALSTGWRAGVSCSVVQGGRIHVDDSIRLHRVRSPQISSAGVSFTIHHPKASIVHVFGSWNGWARPGLVAEMVAVGVWRTSAFHLTPGIYEYKFLVDSHLWLLDIGNPQSIVNGEGQINSIIEVSKGY